MKRIDESQYNSDYHKRKNKCNRYGCDNFSIYFTNNINYCDDCMYEVKFPDKISRINTLEEIKNTDPSRLIHTLKKDRDKIIQLEELLEKKEDMIIGLETEQENYYEGANEYEFLAQENEELQEEIQELQEHVCHCNEGDEEI